jgi:starch phosphorylase
MTSTRVAGVDQVTDPVCGMPITAADAPSVEDGGRQLRFCSEFCKQQFLRHPHAYGLEIAIPGRDVTWSTRRVAYFTMELALGDDMPTFAGGLGVLAGDTLQSCADLEVPVVALSLVHRRGYLRQVVRDGWQVDEEAPWEPEARLPALAPVVTVEIERRPVQLRAWRHDVIGSTGYAVPVLLLDTDLPDNTAADRRVTDRLYGGDERYRFMQEIVLGVGGVRMLAALGCTGLRTFHLNEGHAALAPLERLREAAPVRGWSFQAIRDSTVFTTHTPVAAGHDRFSRELVSGVLTNAVPGDVLAMLGGDDPLNMTRLAVNLSHYVNGVALRHREVSSDLFPGYEIHQVTNGVHSRRWTCESFKALFDRRIPGWRADPLMLRNATNLPADEVWQAHRVAKEHLLDLVEARSGRRLRPDALTIGFARRATAYKRTDLVFLDHAALRAIGRRWPLQLVFAGKAHPRDEPGKQRIQAVLRAAHELGDDVAVVYLEDYGLELALALVAGCDLWLNTPLRPLEASGTSGMKAAHNGVPSLSVLDGWWREGHVEGVTGWSIGDPAPPVDGNVDGADAADLYRKLERTILPLFHDDRAGWIRVMQHCIALNASFFNTPRMVQQYLLHAYALGPESGGSVAADSPPPAG